MFFAANRAGNPSKAAGYRRWALVGRPRCKRTKNEITPYMTKQIQKSISRPRSGSMRVLWCWAAGGRYRIIRK